MARSIVSKHRDISMKFHQIILRRAGTLIECRRDNAHFILEDLGRGSRGENLMQQGQGIEAA